MIDQKEGETEFPVKLHYDDMVSYASFAKKELVPASVLKNASFSQRRVSIRRHKYFYKPIENTPFSLGIALPEGYGMFELHAEQEIRHSQVNGE